MAAEISALKVNKTQEFATVPPGRKANGCKWVFQTKYNVDGFIKQHKARLVVLGNSQVEGGDFDLTFTRVVKVTLSVAY